MENDRRVSDDNLPLTRGDLKAHEERENAAMEALMTRFLSAFPEGDSASHCEYHKQLIKAAKAEERFWETAQTKAIERGIDGIFGVIKIVVLLAVTGLFLKLGLTLPFFGGK